MTHYICIYNSCTSSSFRYILLWYLYSYPYITTLYMICVYLYILWSFQNHLHTLIYTLSPWAILHNCYPQLLSNLESKRYIFIEFFQTKHYRAVTKFLCKVQHVFCNENKDYFNHFYSILFENELLDHLSQDEAKCSSKSLCSSYSKEDRLMKFTTQMPSNNDDEYYLYLFKCCISASLQC